MKRLILEQSSDEFYTSHSGLTLTGAWSWSSGREASIAQMGVSASSSE